MNPWPASCCSWEGTNTSTGDGTNTLDLTWYIFVHLTVFLPLLCILLTSMINLLFPSLKWWSDFQPPQCNASFGAQRGWVSCPCTSLSPEPSSISSVCGWAFPWMCPDPVLWCHSCLHTFSELLLAVCITTSVFPGWHVALGSVSSNPGRGQVGIQSCGLVLHMLCGVSQRLNSLSHLVTLWFNFWPLPHPKYHCTWSSCKDKIPRCVPDDDLRESAWYHTA